MIGPAGVAVVNEDQWRAVNARDLKRDVLYQRPVSLGQQNGSTQRVETLHFELARRGFPRATFRPLGQLTCDEGCSEKGDEGYPVQRIGNMQGADWRQVEIVVTEGCRKGSKHGLNQSPPGRDYQDGDQIKKARGRRVDRYHPGEDEGLRSDSENGRNGSQDGS